MPNAQKQATAKLHQVNKTEGGMLWPVHLAIGPTLQLAGTA